MSTHDFQLRQRHCGEEKGEYERRDEERGKREGRTKTRQGMREVREDKRNVCGVRDERWEGENGRKRFGEGAGERGGESVGEGARMLLNRHILPRNRPHYFTNIFDSTNMYYWTNMEYWTVNGVFSAYASAKCGFETPKWSYLVLQGFRKGYKLEEYYSTYN